MPISAAQQYFNDAEAFKNCGLLQEAIVSYKKTIEADAFFISAYYNLALVYHQAQQPDHAIANLKKVTELDPNDASAFNNLGVLYVAMGRLHEAKRCFERALSIEEDYQDARDNLEKVLQKLQKPRLPDGVRQTIQIRRYNVGLVTLWYEREQSYLAKAIRDALDSEYNTFVFARNGGAADNSLLQTTGGWDVPNLTVHPECKISREALKDWIVKNNLTAVFFHEEADPELVLATRRHGVKTVGYHAWELFDPKSVPGCKYLYDKIICPTKSCYEKFKKMGMDNVVHIPLGVDLQVFQPKKRSGDKRVRFFHPAEWGGQYDCRGTPFVIDAFQRLNDPDTELLIHCRHSHDVQEGKNIKILYGAVPREEIVRMYQESDVVVLPSKWEGLGLTFLESIGCGLPIITVDAPPMNEFVLNGETGFLCKVAAQQSYPAIFAAGVHVDVNDMVEKMKILAHDPFLRQKMRERTCSLAMASWNLEMFRQGIVKMFGNLLQDFQKPDVNVAVDSKDFMRFGAPSENRLRLVSKDYSDCRLVQKEDGRQFIRKGDDEEPFVIHLVGARWSNYPWGMENEIYRALEQFGVTLIDTDFRQDLERLPKLFQQQAHVMLVIKGNGIPPGLIKGLPCRTILWYQDDVFTAPHALRELAFNGHAFDTVYSFDKSAINVYKQLGMNDVRYLPLAMSPAVHRKMCLPKIHDVSFVGNVYTNRRAFIERLQKRFNVFVAGAFMDEMVRIFNQSKIVLNLGRGQTGIQQRVFETLGCGAFLVTNEIPVQDRLFEDNKHLVYFNQENVERLIEYYLNNDKEREAIAENGYLEAHGKHTFAHRIAKLMADLFPGYPWRRGNNKEPDTRETNVVSFGGVIKNVRPPRKRMRIFAAFANVNWENYNLQPALEEFGEVIRYDWLPRYNEYDPQWHWGKKQQMNMELFQLVKKSHEENPIDVFFGYLSGRLVSPGIVRAITMMGIPTLNLSLDDKAKFFSRLEPTGFAGPADIASAFTLCWTSTKDAVQKYRQVGAHAVFMPAGANPHVFKPVNVPRDIEICFIGQNYGVRQGVITYLRNNGVNIQVFGKGWESGEIPMEKVVELISRSKITLGMGTDTIQYNVVALKGRDFEAPMCGGFYLTQYNPELEEFYDVGKEIACYHSPEDMLRKIRHYLSHPEEVEQIRRAALKRSLAEHTWKKRFDVAFNIMGLKI